MADVMLEFHDGPHATPAEADSGPVYLGIKNITDSGTLDLSDYRPISEEDFAHWTRRVEPRANDVVFTYEATLHRYALIPEGFRGCLGRRIALIRPDASKVVPRYLHFMMLGPEWRSTVTARIISGSTVDRVPIKTFPAFPISIPSLRAQQAVVATLGSIDDLIENNRRRIEVLEKMAQTIYREWFVHFRYPGHEDVGFVNSSLGPIPEGWAVRSVADLCSRIQSGGTPRRSEPSFWTDGTVDWYKTGDLTDSILIGSSEQITEHAVSSSSTRTFGPETILMAIYGSPTVGRLGLVETTSSANQAALGLVANPQVSSTIHLWFVLRELREPLNRIAQGAAQQNVSKKKVAEAQAIAPTARLVDQFTEVAGSPWRLAHRLAHASAVLARTRDLLLPKLVTGEIDVSALDLDALVGATS